MKVRRLPVDPGPAGWNRILPDPAPATPLRGNAKADWLIIGAGFAGLTAARRLTQLCPEAAITVVDATRIGEGPAGRNSGFMIDLPHDLASKNYGGDVSGDIAQAADNRRAITFAHDMARDFDLPEEAFAISGKVNAAATDHGQAHNAAFAKHLSAMDEPCTMYDAAKMRALTGTDYYQSGLFTPGNAMIQPALFVRGVAKCLQEDGVTIHENTPVTALHRDGVWTATTPQGQVSAPKVILAVNGHLNSFGFLPGRLMHVFTYASMTDLLTTDQIAQLGGVPVWGATPADPMGTTVRRISGTGGDRIVIRNRFTFDPSMQVTDRRIADVARDHDSAFAARFPMLADAKMQYRWGGRLCLSLNNVQAIGKLDTNLWSACCQNGLGTAKGTLAGMLAAEMANGVQSEALTRALGAAKPKRLPPRPIAQIGANIRLRWSERKAGREL